MLARKFPKQARKGPMQFPRKIAFIVGAPRCGTTTLARIFGQHPDVCFSSVKEPHFFVRFDASRLAPAAVREKVQRTYLSRFFRNCRENSLLMEGSPTYLYMPERMETILKLWPDAKFIIAARDPLSMIPSLHSRLLVTGDETVRDFAEAWTLVPERKAGRRVPRSCMDPRWLYYDEAAAFATHVERFYEAVGRERCMVVLLDDLSSDPAGTYGRICDFLGLTPFAGTEFKAERTNRTFRIGWLQRLLNRPPKAVQTYLASEKFLQREGQLDRAKRRKLFPKLLKLRKRVLKWNEIPARREPLDASLRKEIARAYRKEIDRFGRLIGRDLGHWLRA
jgi:hypothetical protein